MVWNDPLIMKLYAPSSSQSHQEVGQAPTRSHQGNTEKNHHHHHHQSVVSLAAAGWVGGSVGMIFSFLLYFFRCMISIKVSNITSFIIYLLPSFIIHIMLPHHCTVIQNT
mmetsp:Transcript_16244/g.25105  ORF Transcript_16244/g.25105 Transcript_16244/m.25105 type:complete len:110 (-) Transcript_16244:196-525(-)